MVKKLAMVSQRTFTVLICHRLFYGYAVYLTVIDNYAMNKPKAKVN